MKIDVTCALVRDLLPLYADGVLSKESDAVLEAHLPECPPCASELERLRAPVPVQKKKKTARQSLKTTRRRLLTGIGAALLAVAALFVMFAVREFHPNMNTPVPYYDGLFAPCHAFLSPEDGLTYLNVQIARQPAFEYYGTGGTFNEDVVEIDGVRTGVGYVWVGKGKREMEKSIKKANRYGGRNPDITGYGATFPQLSPMTERQKADFRAWEKSALGDDYREIDESKFANWARDIPITKVYYYDGPISDLLDGDQSLGWSQRNGVLEDSALIWDADSDSGEHWQYVQPTNPYGETTEPPYFVQLEE
ncbi:MAG: zf-HC2 domain-containing protein [Oscillospiraceae bacterium]|jgi:hypothetical protein|nr:zf-HC2 domain-containing protein [Oscillospiraceae bacterium]